MPVLDYSGGRLTAGNAMTTSGWWLLTWLSQVMPLVFFAGGAANLISLRRASSVRLWLAGRLHRLLLLPVLPLFAVWLVVPTVLRDAGVPEQPVALAGAIAAQLLWFLGVYLLTVLATPLLALAHRRFGLAVPLTLSAAAVAVDIARFDGVPLVGYANAVFVWLAVHQFGFQYTDGWLGRLSPRAALGLSAAGFGVTAVPVAFGPYAASMIGIPGEPVSNMSPPAACLVSLAAGQIGLVLAAKRTLTTWAHRPAIGTALGWVGPRFMSIYLWHMPALVVVTGGTVVALGYATPAPGTVLWLAALPAWLAATGLVLVGLLRVFSRFEALPAAPSSPMVSTRRLVAAGLLASGGVLGLAATGFADGPEPWIALVACAFLLGRHAAGRVPATNP